MVVGETTPNKAGRCQAPGKGGGAKRPCRRRRGGGRRGREGNRGAGRGLEESGRGGGEEGKGGEEGTG